MADVISINCLVINSSSPESISRHSIITLNISSDDTVDKLRVMIKERWPTLFEKITSTNFILHKVDTEGVKNVYEQIKFFKENKFYNSSEIFPDESISSHFFKDKLDEKIHVVVKI
ncbi:hypothetical protein C1645_824699 [Glomus cerebriforme]|uniref:Crinkler effector protein N-terminal domain-containing protein n=1 Tax=Glomus cerebriforme TaxID=658196 RepID=A0A397T0K1_9GLOM|nr:hypothetical protein C1645_824699 [Glomus cerebriforme]